ncbi:hypothetical protein [Spirobacillus cienkowskii]|uniref:hypothetical protein n=1 Tax=Spirobacillus cienkowskii TaxID=495820 RepID=UPI0030D331A5
MKRNYLLMSPFLFLTLKVFGLFYDDKLNQLNNQCSAYYNYDEDTKVHVWFTLVNNDPTYHWNIQLATLYENNIKFVDDKCKEIKINKIFNIENLKNKKIGLIVNKEKFFQSIYSITAVRNDGEIWKVPNNKMACIFIISAYAPGKFNRMDWKMNNADCYTKNYETEIYFN